MVQHPCLGTGGANCHQQPPHQSNFAMLSHIHTSMACSPGRAPLMPGAVGASQHSAPHSLGGTSQGCHSGLGPGKLGCHWLYASAHPGAGITHRASGVAPHGGSGACHQGWCPAVPCVCQYPGRMSQTHANCREVHQLHPKGHTCHTQFISILTQCQGVKPHAHTPGALALSGNSPPVGVPNPRSCPSRTPGIPQQAGVLPPPLCFGAATAPTTPLQCMHSPPMAPLLAAPLGKQHNCPLGWGLGEPPTMPHKPPQGCPLATSSSPPTVAAPPPPKQGRATVPLPATLVALPPPLLHWGVVGSLGGCNANPPP